MVLSCYREVKAVRNVVSRTPPPRHSSADRRGRRRSFFVFFVARDLRVGAVDWGAGDDEPAAREVEHPVVGDAGAGVDAGRDFEIDVKRDSVISKAGNTSNGFGFRSANSCRGLARSTTPGSGRDNSASAPGRTMDYLVVAKIADQPRDDIAERIGMRRILPNSDASKRLRCVRVHFTRQSGESDKASISCAGSAIMWLSAS